MDKIDSRSLPLDALNERRRRAVKMRLDGTSLKDTASQCEMSRTTVIAAVKQWLDEEHPVIAACAKVEGAEIHRGDQTGLRSDDVRGGSYAPQGQTPVIRVDSKRHGLSVISTVTNKGQMR